METNIVLKEILNEIRLLKGQITKEIEANNKFLKAESAILVVSGK